MLEKVTKNAFRSRDMPRIFQQDTLFPRPLLTTLSPFRNKQFT